MKTWMDFIPKNILGEDQQQVQPPQMKPVGYTGNGGDGVVQPRKPVEMVQSKGGPVMLHEGEGKMQNPDGSVTVIPQSQLQAIEMKTGMKGMADGGTYDPANQLAAVGTTTTTATPTTASTNYFNKGMEAIGKTAAGESPAMKSMENKANLGFGGAQIAAQGAAAQNAAQSGLDMQTIGAVKQQTARNMEGERSTMQANIAQTKQSAAETASGQLASFGIQGKAQEQTEKVYGDSKKQTDWDRMLLYYDPSTTEGLNQLQSAYTEMFGGTAPDFNVLKEQRDYTKTKQQQDVTSGEKMLTAQELQNVSTQLGINSSTSQAMINDINSGATKDYIQQRYGITLSDDQYNSLSEQYGQKVTLGTLSITSQSIANTASQLGIDTQKMQNVITAINSGATKSYLENYLGVKLTDAEYKGLSEKYAQDVKIGNITIKAGKLANAATKFNNDYTKTKSAIELINSGATKAYVESQLGVKLSDADYKALREEYSLGYDTAYKGYEQLLNKVGDEKFGSMISRISAGMSMDSLNKEFPDAKITAEQYDGLWEQTDGYFKKQGLTMEQAQLYGYDQLDANGKQIIDPVTKMPVHVPGLLENSKRTLDLQEDSFDMQYLELFGGTDSNGNTVEGKYDLLSEENKRAADGMFGYDVVATSDYDIKDSKGNIVGHVSKGDITGRVKGSAEIAELTYDLHKQGLDNETAQVQGFNDPESGLWVKGSVQLAAEASGREVDSMYGYYYDSKTGEVVTDPAEILKRGNSLTKVDGALSLAANSFGLNEKTYEDQHLELFGGYDPKTGKDITGKYDLLSNEDQRAANTLYGYLGEEWVMNDETGKYEKTETWHQGTLQLQMDETAIKKQGLSLDEAKLYGYEKDGKHIDGALEVESKKMDLLQDEYESQQASTQGTALAAYFNTQKSIKGYNYENDPAAKKLLQAYWTSMTGNSGTYDETWAENQFQATTMSEVDAALNSIESEEWFIALDVNEQEETKKLVSFAAMLSVTQGIQPVYDESGEKITGLKDSDGDLIYKTKNYVAAKELPSAQEKLDNYTKVISSLNADIGSKVTQSTWESLGQPDANTLDDWYNNKGGKYYNNLSNAVSKGEDFNLTEKNILGIVDTLNNEQGLMVGASKTNASSESLNKLNSTVMASVFGNTSKENAQKTFEWMKEVTGITYDKHEAEMGYANLTIDNKKTAYVDPAKYDTKSGTWLKLNSSKESNEKVLTSTYGYSAEEAKKMVDGGATWYDVYPQDYIKKMVKDGYTQESAQNIWKIMSNSRIATAINSTLSPNAAVRWLKY